MSYIDSTAATAGTTSTTPTTGTSSFNQLADPSTFLQLLVAQLQNQDPDNPTDPTSFMTEIAQLTSVESQTTLDSQEQAVAADSMLGKEVTGSSTSGTVTGTVTSVLLSSTGDPQLAITLANGTTQDVDISAVTQVSQAPSTSDGSGTSAGTASPTSTTTPTSSNTAA